MLPIGKNVKDVALGEDGIINQENTDLIFIDMSTILPADTIASALPDLTSCIAMPIEEFLPFRTAALGFSLASII